MARTEVIPSIGDVNPLGGTVVGSPAPDFGGVNPAAQSPSAQSPSAGAPSAQTPGGSPQAFAQTALSQAVTPPGAGAPGQLPMPERPAGDSVGGALQSAGAAVGASSPAVAAPGALAVATSGAAPRKTRNPVATLLTGMLRLPTSLFIQMLGELKRFARRATSACCCSSSHHHHPRGAEATRMRPTPSAWPACRTHRSLTRPLSVLAVPPRGSERGVEAARRNGG